MSRRAAAFAAAVLAAGFGLALTPDISTSTRPASAMQELSWPDEKRLRNVRQLTFGGQNAEAYWSPDGRFLVYQASPDAAQCDQEYVLEMETGRSRRVSDGKGRTTCGYFHDGGRRVLFATTGFAAPHCPAPPDFSKGYAWALHAGFDIVSVAVDGSDLRRLTGTPGYDAEATASPDGKAIVFTSVRDGDLEIYTMDIDGGNVRRLTNEPGYDGGPFFSPDGKRIVYRRDAAASDEVMARYKERLAQGLYAPGGLEIWVMDRDGMNKTQVTRLGASSFAPYFHPDGRRIIFSSNHPEPKRRNFDLYMIGVDGSGLERVTTEPTFDGFPMFSPDGKRLVFASNRNGKVRGETNIFVADWVESP